MRVWRWAISHLGATRIMCAAPWAMGYVPAELASGGQKARGLKILGEMYRAEVQAVPLYDPDGLKNAGVK